MDDSTFGPMISAYPHEDAIRDGVLINVTKMAREAGIKLDCALTVAAWTECVAWSEADNERKGTSQNETGRLWEVLFMFTATVRRKASAESLGSSSLLYALYVVPREGQDVRASLRRLVAVCRPGDDHRPVLTIMLPDES